VIELMKLVDALIAALTGGERSGGVRVVGGGVPTNSSAPTLD
jgi:hypothetical protein